MGPLSVRVCVCDGLKGRDRMKECPVSVHQSVPTQHHLHGVLGCLHIVSYDLLLRPVLEWAIWDWYTGAKTIRFESSGMCRSAVTCSTFLETVAKYTENFLFLGSLSVCIRTEWFQILTYLDMVILCHLLWPHPKSQVWSICLSKAWRGHANKAVLYLVILMQFGSQENKKCHHLRDRETKV